MMWKLYTFVGLVLFASTACIDGAAVERSSPPDCSGDNCHLEQIGRNYLCVCDGKFLCERYVWPKFAKKEVK